MRNSKIVCLAEVCKIDKPPSLSVKTLKNMKRWKMDYFFKFEIFATNIDLSQIFKNICQ